jgi:hypothetical protein
VWEEGPFLGVEHEGFGDGVNSVALERSSNRNSGFIVDVRACDLFKGSASEFATGQSACFVEGNDLA